MVPPSSCTVPPAPRHTGRVKGTQGTPEGLTPTCSCMRREGLLQQPQQNRGCRVSLQCQYNKTFCWHIQYIHICTIPHPFPPGCAAWGWDGGGAQALSPSSSPGRDTA